MIDQNALDLFKQRFNSLTADGKGDDFSFTTRGLTLGLVVNTDDPLEQGRLQIYCPSLNDNPKKIFHLPWCVYITPFGGSINNKGYTRGTGDPAETPYSEGAVHYGFWAIPEMGAHVLVGCIDGDPRRRFWIGSVPEHQETHTMLNGRYDWSAAKGTPDGPLTSKKKPIQPIYDNWTSAFADRKSREWKTRGADYQVTAVNSDNDGAPNRIKGNEYLDDSYEGISKAEKDKWVKDLLGGHGYDFSGFKGAGAYKASRVCGMSTPGFHAMTMDDRPFNNRMKFRTSTGHQILLDDTNERIYIMTNRGKNWIELDSNGNIDMYSDRRISINAAKDINFTTGGTFRVHAEQGIHMYAGHSLVEARAALNQTPMDGEIRIQSEADMHVIARNIRNQSLENSYHEVGVSRYEVVGESSFLDVKTDINMRTLEGDFIKNSGRDFFETITRDSKRLSYGKSAITSNDAMEMYSFEAGLSVGSKTDASFKSASGNVDIEAMGQGTDSGNVRMNSPNAQMEVGDVGLSGLTSESTNFKASKNIELEISETKTQSKKGGVGATVVNIEGLPDIGDCAIAPPPPVNVPPGQPLSMTQAASVAYNAGWRGDDLIIATALMRGESSNNPSATNGTATTGKWGPAVGLFQIRTLNNPDEYSGTVDGLRDNRNGELLDPNENARVAYKIWEKCNPPMEWTVGKWESFQSDRIATNFTAHVDEAANAVNLLCGNAPNGTFMGVADNMEVTYDEIVCDGCEDAAHDHEIMAGEMMMGGPVGTSAFLMSATSMTLQSATDIDFKAMASGYFNGYTDIVTKLNSTIVQTDMLSYYTSLLTTAVSTLASAVSKPFTLPAGMSFDIGGLVSSIYSGAMPPALTQVAGSLSTLNSQITALGGLGMTLPLTMENMVSQLQGNTAALSALGLPTDLSFPINPATQFTTMILSELTKAVNSIDIPILEIPDFRTIAKKIFQNNTYPLGQGGPL